MIVNVTCAFTIQQVPNIVGMIIPQAATNLFNGASASLATVSAAAGSLAGVMVGKTMGRK